MLKMLIFAALTIAVIGSRLVFLPEPEPEPEPFPPNCTTVFCPQCPDGTTAEPTEDDCCGCVSILK